jgi:hypothetical protein
MNDKATHNGQLDEEFVSAKDIWQLLTTYKYVFFMVFSLIFCLGGIKIFLEEPKYTFYEVIELGRLCDDVNSKIPYEINKVVLKIKKVFFPLAIKKYNQSGAKKLNFDKYTIKVETDAPSSIDAAMSSGVIIISIDVPLSYYEGCKVVFQDIFDSLAKETDFIDSTIKKLINRKQELESKLIEIGSVNSFYHIKKDSKSTGDGKACQTVIFDLSKEIFNIQTQIERSFTTKVLLDFSTSPSSLNIDKWKQMIFVFILSLIFSFFGVFVTASSFNDFKLRRRKYN